MVAAGFVVEGLAQLFNLVPAQRTASVVGSHISWDYTTWLNIGLLLAAAALVVRFTAGGKPMLAMMGGDPHTPLRTTTKALISPPPGPDSCGEALV